jgi:hypothetical protein
MIFFMVNTCCLPLEEATPATRQYFTKAFQSLYRQIGLKARLEYVRRSRVARDNVTNFPTELTPDALLNCSGH